jgi:hypothetical protein
MNFLYAGGLTYASGGQYANGKLGPDHAGLFCKNHPLFSCRVRGIWKNKYIFQVRGRFQMMRIASTYDLSTKAHLITYQPKFAAAVAAWKTLPPATKLILDTRASKLGLQYAGYHYFISLWLKDKPELSRYYP